MKGVERGVKVVAVVFFVLLGLYPCYGAESGYPSRAIEMTIGYAPGAGTDLGARMVAEQAKKFLGQDIVCVNKPGGGGRLALTLTAKAKPDGYSIGASTDSAIILSPIMEKVPYNPTSDFTFITQFGLLDFGNVVMADSPFKTFKDVVDFIEKNPDKLTVSTTGEGTVNHIVYQALMKMKGWKVKLVPFNGAAPAMTALLGGHVMVASTATSGFAPYIKSKQVRNLAWMGEERVPEYPGVPTFKELGFPMISFQSWYVISGPKGMDKAVVKKLSDAFQKAMQTPEFLSVAQKLEITERKPRHGDELTNRILSRYKDNVELFTKLGMAAK